MSDFSAPDFDRIGEHYERYLPQVHAVSLALLDRLPPPRAGERYLDVACGTGEPGLTLLRRHPDIELLGVDPAAGMIAIAERKVAREGLTGARFTVLPFEAVPLAAASFDRVLSRFGLLMFGDAPRGAAELARLLVPDGCFSLAVWDDMELNTLMYSTVAALHDHLVPAQRPSFAPFEALAVDGYRTRLLREAGLSQVETEPFTWTMDFPDFDHAWAMVAGPGVLLAQFASLTPAAVAAVEERLRELLEPYTSPTGALQLPHTCRLFWGRR